MSVYVYVCMLSETLCVIAIRPDKEYGNVYHSFKEYLFFFSDVVLHVNFESIFLFIAMLNEVKKKPENKQKM